MNTQNIAIEFQGYWREKKKRGIPSDSGIYCVYTCIYSGKKQTCSPQKLVYIGAAGDVRTCLDNHPGQEAWESHIDTGEELCYSFAPVAPEHRDGYAAALIARNKPPENTDSGRKIDEATFILTGSAAFLARQFSTGQPR